MNKNRASQFKCLTGAVCLSLLIACSSGGGGSSGGSGSSGATLSDIDGDGVNNSLDLDADGDGLIEIRTQQELDQMRFVLNGTGRRTSATDSLNTSGCQNSCRGYELLTDIALSLTDPAGWQPIGEVTFVGLNGNIGTFSTQHSCDGQGFSAVFDGNGRTISNLQINRTEQSCIGLFAKVSGEIRNLKIQATEIKGKNGVGTLAGDASFAKIIATHTSTKIVEGFGNSSISGLVGVIHNGSISHSSAQTDAIVNPGIHTGGLTGQVFFTNITSSAALSINITVGEVAESALMTGGLIGWCLSANIRDSFSISENIISLSSDPEANIAGFAGYCGGGSIINSYALNGLISGRGGQIGGLIGQDQTPFTDLDLTISIRDSYALSEQINGGDNIGGLGGIIQQAKIFSSYAITGSISGSSGSIGGLLGRHDAVKDIEYTASSYAISGRIKGSTEVGGLIGEEADDSSLGAISSYAITHSLQGNQVGGLIGVTSNPLALLASSYAITSNISGGDDLSGLIGQNHNHETMEGGRTEENPITISSSYAVTDTISGGSNLGGLIGKDLDSHTIIRSSYWDNLTNGNTTSLQSTALADEWTNNDTLGDNAVWCDENHNAVIEENEKRDDNLIWEFGDNDQYPVIACTPPNVLKLNQERWRELKNGKPNVPDSAELTQLIRDYRNRERAAFSPEQLGTP